MRIILDPRERHDFVKLGDLSDTVRIKRGGAFMHLKAYEIDAAGKARARARPIALPRRCEAATRTFQRYRPKAGTAIFRNELGKKLEKSSDNGCMFSLVFAETLSHGGKR